MDTRPENEDDIHEQKEGKFGDRRGYSEAIGCKIVGAERILYVVCCLIPVIFVV